MIRKLGILLTALLFASTVKAQQPSFAIVDLTDEQDNVILAYNETEQVSIASITKLMTALVVLKSSQNLDEKIRVQNIYRSNNLVKGQLAAGLMIPRKQVLLLALVSSDNRAAYTLAASYPGGSKAFVRKMNETAEDLELNSTSFVDPTGIMAGNKSSVVDVIKIAREASKYDIIRQAAMTSSGQISIPAKKNKLKKISFNSTNHFVNKLDIEVAKTGFTRAAGRCLVMIIDEGTERYAVVVLGAQSNIHRSELVNFLLEHR